MPVRVTFILDEIQHQKLRIATAERKETISKMLRRAIDEYLTEDKKLPTPPKSQSQPIILSQSKPITTGKPRRKHRR